jgi:hypothetical protein
MMLGLCVMRKVFFALFGHLRQHLAKCRGSPAIFVGRHDETAFRQVGGLFDVFKFGEYRRLKGLA